MLDVKQLRLDRPLVFVDLETTGINTSVARIVEVTVLKFYPDGAEEERSVRVNPGIPIPPVATKVHGITDDEVADKPLFNRYAKSLLEFFDGCDIGGFNAIRFDIPLLVAEFERRYISQLLEEHDGNISAAARAAGIDRMSIHKMLNRLGLSNPGRG